MQECLSPLARVPCGSGVAPGLGTGSRPATPPPKLMLPFVTLLTFSQKILATLPRLLHRPPPMPARPKSTAKHTSASIRFAAKLWRCTNKLHPQQRRSEALL